MPIYYVKPDSDNKFPEKDTMPVLEPADGLRTVNIPTTSVQYFTRYWWMYAFKDDSSQELKAPGNLPPLDNDYLQELIDQQKKQIDQQTTDIQSLQKANKDLKSSNELTQQGLMEAVDYLSSQLTPASTTTGTDSTATSSAAPASSAASES
ncbi:hypothetical protein [Levilactobacillus brevis]|uniref:hypothetical protein n=1 Tax=Levilactobacillus brevis TaxID=1580 RepID=UPI000BE8177E|nr:hypothetical protein [Levilactobacillus brevis]MCZ2118647.1 hypothetical protein [Levilactobacillus brevis]MCZ2124169.1 hypothetical protein [Levilactobacillus brevis]MCZ2208489.1 hypothetical protein [Levilactobacillus brevis]MCZ2323953.1 hypothetical protein [Levilactobacillus brevis]